MATEDSIQLVSRADGSHYNKHVSRRFATILSRADLRVPPATVAASMMAIGGEP